MIEKIRDMLKRKPFVPFAIVLADGKRFEVSSPRSVAIGQSQLIYCFPHSDRSAQIRANEIVSLEKLQQAA